MALRIDTPEAAVAATPYLIGFTPQDSLVLLVLDEHKLLQMSVRVDLPVAGDLEWLRALLQGISGPDPAAVLMLAYADTLPAEHAEAVETWMLHVFLPVLDVVDAVIVADGRFVSLSRDERIEDRGRRLDELAEHPVVASCVAAGMTTVSRREDLVEAIEPIDDAITQQVRRRLREAVSDQREQRDDLEDRSLGILLGEAALSPEDITCVARACRDVRIRDPLLALLLDGEDRAGDLGRVRTRLVFCLRHTPGRHAGAVAATLSLLCWADGDGASALVAVDRALAADPSNTLAPLVAGGLQNGLPPNTWATLTGDIPLEVLRGGYRRSA